MSNLTIVNTKTNAISQIIPRSDNNEAYMKMGRTISLAHSSHTSSLLGHSSHPFIIKFRAACNFPVTSSKRAEAIQAEMELVVWFICIICVEYLINLTLIQAYKIKIDSTEISTR